VKRLLVGLAAVFLLSGCELLKPVTAKEAQAEAGRYSHRTDLGGYYRLDNGGVGFVRPQSWRR